MSNNSLHLPTQESLELRFKFVKDTVLRSNLVIAFRYLIYLLTLHSDSTLPPEIRVSICKDIILYTASIVESCLHYYVRCCLLNGKFEERDIFEEEWKDHKTVKVHTLSENEVVYGVVKVKYVPKFTKNCNFVDLNKAAKRCGLFDATMFKKAEDLRTRRNKVHLSGLDRIDTSYTKADIDLAFLEAKQIIERIEKNL